MRKLTKQHKNNIHKAMKGKMPKFIPNNKGRVRSKANKKKISDTLKRKGIKPPVARMENHHWWKGGLSFEEYTVDWNETLKRSIRERDKYICQLCSCQQGDNALDVHHIDYNKKNCNPDNLITLCRSCHSKTNVNRNYWTKFWGNEVESDINI